MNIEGTTVLAVTKEGKTAIAADGQVSLGSTVLKHQANKLRKLYDGKVLAGFAGSTADALTLFELFEGKLKEYSGELSRAAVELAKQWRTDRILRKLEAFMIVAAHNRILLLSGMGDVLEPDYNICAIGSGGNYAYAAARAYYDHEQLDARDIVEKSLQIAAEICVYTNDAIRIEVID